MIQNILENNLKKIIISLSLYININCYELIMPGKGISIDEFNAVFVNRNYKELNKALVELKNIYHNYTNFSNLKDHKICRIHITEDEPSVGGLIIFHIQSIDKRLELIPSTLIFNFYTDTNEVKLKVHSFK
jgi:hypothetical protein